MDAHQVEPIIFLGAGLVKFYFTIPKSAKQSFIPNVTHTIQCQFCPSFLEQNGLDGDIV